MTSAAQARRRQRPKAALLALALCEAEARVRPRVSAITARAALRATGLPPHVAAALRSRLRLIPEPEADR
jgi:hypothetical protein